MIGKIVLPVDIPDRVRTAVLKRAADRHGGFTIVGARGGWVNDSGDLVREPVEIVRIGGADANWLESTANWVAQKTAEETVYWSVSEGSHGLADGSIGERREVRE